MYNLAKLYQNTCQVRGSRNFLTYLQDETLIHHSFNIAGSQIKLWATFLRRRGVKRGDRVAFMTPKSPHQIRMFYACWWIGAIAVPVCEGLSDQETAFIFKDCEPGLILCDETSLTKCKTNAGGTTVITFESLPLTGDASAIEIDEVEDDAVAALIYTSGSTGMPKGVILTHKNFYRNAESALQAVSLTETDTIMSLLPYWHSFGLTVEVVTAVMAGMEIAIPKDKRDFKKNIHLYQPTIVLLVPRIADALRGGILKRIDESAPRVQELFKLAIHNASRIFTAVPKLDGGLLRMLTHHTFYDPFIFRRVRHAFGGKLRFFVSGGAPLDLEHQIFFKYMGVPIYQGYGLTEATPFVSTNSDTCHKLGSCGPVLSWLTPAGGGDYTFRDEDGNLGKNLHGELLVRGDCVMKGYWRHQDASSKTLADGWLHTGDIAYMDSDGFLFIDGRKNNMIVLAGGEKLHPEHVEDAIKSCDLISEAMVIGDKCKNIYVCVTLEPEAAEKIAKDDILPLVQRKIAETTNHLVPAQRPKDVLILPSFSVEDGTITVSLKIRRFRIWELYAAKINAFLKVNGEDIATKAEVGIASSKVLESLSK